MQRRTLDLLGERVLLGDAAFADDAAHRRGLGETLKNFSAEILAKDVVAIHDAPNLDELWPPFFVKVPAQIRMEHVVVDRAGPDDRDLDHQVVDVRGLMGGSIDTWARLSI